MVIEKEKRHAELKKMLNTYSRQYYLLDAPSISDAEYDKLYNELLAIEKEYPELKNSQSPSQKVGITASRKFKKIIHSTEMLSLENAYNENDISNFFNRIRKLTGLDEVDVILEPKFDGLSIALKYKNGFLITAATRGDGHVGEDVTQNMMTMNIPKKIHEQKELEIRGEVIMLKSDFRNLNDERKKKSERLFANPRNAAAGSIRQLDTEITRSRKLQFFPYSIISNDLKFDTQMSVLEKLKEFGFAISDKITVCKNQMETHIVYTDLEKHRADLEYDIDGVVYKVNDLRLQAKLGASTKFPRHSIAYKFTAEKAETTIIDIILQVGRTGNITPVAELMPVTIGGVVVSRATLHNKDEIEKKDIRISDRVIIQRAGDVIPKILYPIINDRSPGSVPFIFPDKCPSCGSKLIQEESEVAIKCINLNCEAQIIEHLVHFVSRGAFNIDGFGEQNIKFFFQKGIVKSPPDIFEIENKNSEIRLEKIDGWGKQSVSNLFSAINNSRHISLDRFIYALGIPQVGRAVSKLVAGFFISYKKFIECIEDSKYENLLNINGIGTSIVNDMKNFFKNENNMSVIKRLEKHIVIEDSLASNNSELFGATIVFTGTMSSISREDAKKLVEKLGAKVTSSVSSKTSFIVAGENAGKKLEDAKKLNIKIISEEDFKKNFEKNSQS